MELMEKERRQREQVIPLFSFRKAFPSRSSLSEKRVFQMFMLKAEQLKRCEKEKITRINQAREQGWKHILTSSGGSSPERKCFVRAVKRAAGAASPAPASSKSPPEQSHPALDQTAKPQHKDASWLSAGPRSPLRGDPAAAGPVLPSTSSRRFNHGAIKRELQRLQCVSKHVHISRQRGQMAAERAFQVEEFLQRKREAMLNKVRAEGQLEYLTRLRQIRLQNFNERQQIKARLRGEKYDSDGSDSQEANEEAELRRKKIEALKVSLQEPQEQSYCNLLACYITLVTHGLLDSFSLSSYLCARQAQANARAAVLKEQLEKKRQEAHEREKRAWEDHLASKGLKEGLAGGGAAVSSTSDSEAPAPPASNPSSPAISMTAALKNIGAITSPKETISDPAAAIQSQKTLILQRLNQNLKPQSPGGGSAPAPSEPGPAVQQNPPSSNGDRRKWEAAELPVLPLSEETSKETCPAVHGEFRLHDKQLLSSSQKNMIPSPTFPVQPPLQKTDLLLVGTGGGGTPVFLWWFLPLSRPWRRRALRSLVRLFSRHGSSKVCSCRDAHLCFLCAETDHTVGDVIQMGGLLEDVPREEWGASPVGQGLRVLQEAEPQSLSQQMASSTMNEDGPSGCDKPDPAEELTSSEDRSVAEETPNLHETQGPVDLECVVLEEGPKPASSSPVDVQQAWQLRPLDAVSRPTDMMETEKNPEPSASLQQEEPLFVKFCSPVHRRTAALAVLSAQSSMDESSSSLASRSRSVSPLRSKQQNALLIGLSTGMFDANNPKMLRTCSLPDLGRLFSPQREGAATSTADAVPENNLELEDLEDAAKEEEQSEAEDAYEDEDLQDIRASMERLLQEEAEEAVMAAGDLNGNPAGDAEQEPFSRQPSEMDPNNQMAVDEEEEDDDDEEGDDDEEEADEEDEECSNGSPGDEEAGELLSNGMGEERCRNNKQLNEEWHSDGSEEDQGGGI
uniref:NIMA-related kinase 1 n=1 Tax=Oryzias sinensis TaxID=183150 RepID=A0A8C7Z779_9TELE